MVVLVNGTTTTSMTVRPYWNAAQISVAPDAAGYSVSGILTTALSANFAANTPLFLARLDPSAGTGYRACITRLTVQWTTIAAFTTGVLVARRLSLYRGSGAGGANGTSLTAVRKASVDPLSEMSSGQGGDIRITASGSALTTAATFETPEILTMPLMAANAAGYNATFSFEFDTSQGVPLTLAPGELIAIRNPINMDSAGSGTFELGVTMEWQESVL